MYKKIIQMTFKAIKIISWEKTTLDHIIKDIILPFVKGKNSNITTFPS